MKENTHHFWQHCFSCTIIAMPVLLTLLLRTAVAQAASLKSCQPSWKVVGSDNIANGAYYRNYLTSVSAISTTDAWAVGYYDDGEGLTSGILRWDGSYFHVVSNTPDTSILYGVAAISATDVWAVGENYNATTVVEHWDGTQWSLIASPNAGIINVLNGMVAISSNDIWAVGYYQDSSRIGRTLIEHWDGTNWSIVPSPNNGTDVNVLSGVAAASATDIWAVGFDNPGGQSLIEHWDGTQWSIVPNPGTAGLNGVAVIASNDIWAVGGTLIQHWDGTSWTIVPSASTSGLAAVTAISSNNVWAAGDRMTTEHWNGTQWKLSLAQSAAQPSLNSFRGATAIPNSKEVFAVGTAFYPPPDDFGDTLVYLYAC